MNNMQYGSRKARVFAALIDGVILWLVAWVVSLFLLNVLTDFQTRAWMNWGVSILIAIVYWVGFQYYFGQTLGKKALKIKVVDPSGNKPSLVTFFLREIVGKFASAVTFGIGYLMVFWDKKRQALHDKIADTYVVKA